MVPPRDTHCIDSIRSVREIQFGLNDRLLIVSEKLKQGDCKRLFNTNDDDDDGDGDTKRRRI